MKNSNCSNKNKNNNNNKYKNNNNKKTNKTSKQFDRIRRKDVSKKTPKKAVPPKNFNRPKPVPLGRTLSTYDRYLGKQKSISTKERPVVVIAVNADNDLAVVPLSKSAGNNKTRLRNYQQRKSYFKHYIEIEDDEGKPIRVNEKFRANNEKMDVSNTDVKRIIDKVLYHSRPSSENREKIKTFRKKKSPRN